MDAPKIQCWCGRIIAVAPEHLESRVRCKCGRTMYARGLPSLRARLRRPLRRLSYAYLAVICVLTITMWAGGDVWWPSTVLLFIGRWIFLVPLIVLVPAAIVLQRALILPVAFAGVVCLGPLVGFRVGLDRFKSHPPGQTLRLLTFNASGGYGLAPQLTDIINEWHPDVLALQECGPLVLDEIRRLTGWYHHYERQLCFLSKYPILDTAVMDRSAFKVLEESGAGIGGSADVVRYAVQLPNDTVSITNLHLETPRKGLEGLLQGELDESKMENNTLLRGAESQLARRWVDSSTHPTLVAGDFNMPVESRVFRHQWAGLRDVFSSVGFGLGMTRYNGWIRVRIDHVLMGPGWYADRVQLGPSVGSDHRSLIVDLTLVRAH